VLETSLRLLHPYMPFLTEELWQNLKKNITNIQGESIMIAAYPAADESTFDADAESEIEAVIEIIRSIRNVRAQYKVEAGRWVEIKVYTGADRHAAISRYDATIKTLARANPVSFLAGEPGEKLGGNTLVLPLAQATVVIPLASMFNLEAEKKRMDKELEQAQNEVDRLEARLKDDAFLTRAPETVVAKERQKFYTLKDKLEKLRQQHARL
jgi:valyl-tRNA synthetase